MSQIADDNRRAKHSEFLITRRVKHGVTQWEEDAWNPSLSEKNQTHDLTIKENAQV